MLIASASALEQEARTAADEPSPAVPNVATEADTDTATDTGIATTASAPEEKPVVQAAGIAKLEGVVRDHPSIQSATQDVCQAYYNVLQGRAAYFPIVSMSLNGGNKWIDQTTRSDEIGGTNSPEYDGKGLNGTLTLRQQIYDWGRTSSTVRGAQEERASALLRRLLRLEEQLGEYYRMAFQYVLQTQLVAHLQGVKAEMDKGVVRVEARFKAGAARLSDVRQAKIYALETETLTNQAVRDRDAVVRAMKTSFGLAPEDARLAVRAFIATRPDIPDMVPPEQTLTAQLINRNIARARADHRRLQAERLPTFTGVVTARGWDITEKEACSDGVAFSHPDADTNRRLPNSSLYARNQNCRTHELVGSIEFSMPLFDGGANAAQRGGANAQRKGLEAELVAQARQHNAESRRLQDRLLSQLEQLAKGRERLRTLTEQFESEQIVQERTRADPIGLMSLQQTLANTQAQQIGLTMQAEVTRMDALERAGLLARTLNISLEGSGGC